METRRVERERGDDLQTPTRESAEPQRKDSNSDRGSHSERGSHLDRTYRDRGHNREEHYRREKGENREETRRGEGGRSVREDMHRSTRDDHTRNNREELRIVEHGTSVEDRLVHGSERRTETQTNVVDSRRAPSAERRPDRLMRGPKDYNESYDPYGRPRGRYDRVDPQEMELQRQHLDPSSAVNNRSRRKVESMLRNDSLSSDPSDVVRPPPPKPHKHKKGRKPRQASLSSSDDDIQTTPECTSCDDAEIESESVSEKGKVYCITHLLYFLLAL